MTGTSEDQSSINSVMMETSETRANMENKWQISVERRRQILAYGLFEVFLL